MHKKSRKQDLTYYAKLLIVISITFLFYGFILDLDNETRFINLPTEETSPIVEDGSTVSVTPVDDNVASSGNDNTSPESVPIYEDYSNEESVVQNDDTSSSLSAIDYANNKLRNDIQNTFGITIRYGSETDGYEVKSSNAVISTESIKDPYTVNTQLNYLKNTLNLYPDGLFQEIKDGGIPLTVLLINNYSQNSITGITDSNYTYAHISIAAIYSFEESFYHESYHYIERYLFKKGVNFNSWNTLNPADFTYGDVYNGYSYTNTFLETSPFVNNYAQTADTEDRASTFEYMMASTKASCLNYSQPVWKKAKYMADTMDYVLSSASSDTTEYWERFL